MDKARSQKPKRHIVNIKFTKYITWDRIVVNKVWMMVVMDEMLADGNF
ncbi:hypothetical protein BLGI_2810 [Brevibacillus laterosporus GI-9]|nr:hypothetical protein BLGI_2810 [Brevibacillus laterosporus GI-9]